MMERLHVNGFFPAGTEGSELPLGRGKRVFHVFRALHHLVDMASLKVERKATHILMFWKWTIYFALLVETIPRTYPPRTYPPETTVPPRVRGADITTETLEADGSGRGNGGGRQNYGGHGNRGGQ